MENEIIFLQKNWCSLYWKTIHKYKNLLQLGVTIIVCCVDNIEIYSTKFNYYKIIILTNMVEKKFPLLRLDENVLVPMELKDEFKIEILKSEYTTLCLPLIE